MIELSPERLEELNRKIAEWVGFAEVEHHPCYCPTQCKYWHGIDGEFLGKYGDLPDFPHDMQACFEHIVPKLRKLGCSWYIGQPEGDIVHSHIHWIAKDKKFSGYDEEPATALCLAVEKLISKEGR